MSTRQATRTLLTALLLAPLVVSQAAETNRPNILIVINDDQIGLNTDGDVLRAAAVCDPLPGVPDWLPNIERRAAGGAAARPALLFTRGLNAGGFAKNKNEIKTQVWLQVCR